MEHVVFWSGADGRPAFERTPSLDEAVGVVSRLRNDHGIDGARVYQLNEVPLTVRVEYKIEVPADKSAPMAAPAAPTAPVVPMAPPLEEVLAGGDVTAEPAAHLSVVRDDHPAHPAEMPVAEVPVARTGDVLPDAVSEDEVPAHHRGRGMGFFSSNR